MNNYLKITNLNFKYKEKLVLNDINISIKNGLIALLGPNGAGKSTLLKLISTIYETNSGTIELNGVKYQDKSLNRSNIGYLPQDFDIYKNITGRDYLSFVLDIRNGNKCSDEIDRVCTKLGLDSVLDNKIRSYSGGMKRRLGIAQAIIGDVNIVILDEPTVGLDPEQRIYFRNIISHISKDKIVLVSTHIVEDIEFGCDDLIILNKGEVVFNGLPTNFINSFPFKLFQCTVNIEDYLEISQNVKIVERKDTNNGIKIKYISDHPINSQSVIVDYSLSDVYLHFLEENSFE